MIYVTHDQIEAMTLADRIVVMHGGDIQQQGTPEELFKNPRNKFVAGFLGTPPMNFLVADIVSDGQATYLEGSGFRLRCDDYTANRLHGYSHKQVTVGIRPSDLHNDVNASADEAIEVNVVVSEYIGVQSVLIGDCGGQKVMVEVKSDAPVALGNTLKFRVDYKSLHLFDAKTDLAID